MTTNNRRKMRTKTIGPLRKVVRAYKNNCGATIEVLSCGHEQHEKHDIIGPTNAVSRRCRKCLGQGQS